MTNYLEKIIIDIELQSVEGIKECFENGISPDAEFKNQPLIYEVISGYPRGEGFKKSIKAFVDYGVTFDDKVLLAVLLDDPQMLKSFLAKDDHLINKRYSLDCAFTQMLEVTLLHVCAEYNHLACAEILVQHGLNVNAQAGTDEYGFGGQTAIFHTVNQNGNKCIDVLKFLVSQGADLGITVKGIIWGKSYEWETFIPAVNPISYAMMGLLPQFQRKEKLIYEVVSILLEAAHGKGYMPSNIPNKYLNS